MNKKCITCGKSLKIGGISPEGIKWFKSCNHVIDDSNIRINYILLRIDKGELTNG